MSDMRPDRRYGIQKICDDRRQPIISSGFNMVAVALPTAASIGAGALGYIAYKANQNDTTIIPYLLNALTS